MTSLEINVFSPSESEKLKNLLKNPDEDLQEILSLLEKKMEENKRQYGELNEQYHSLIDGLTHVGIGIDIVSKDHEVIIQNQVLKERFGDLTGKSCYRSYMGLKEPCEFCPMEEALKYNRVERTELTASDGRSYELISAPYPNQDGSINKVVEVVIDITVRKNAEQKLKESEEKYRYFIEHSIEGVWVVDENANTVLVNPSMAEMLGYTMEEMVGQSLFAFMDKESTELTRYHLEKRKKGISEERDAVMIHKNGHNVNLRIRATPIFNKEDRYDGTYAFLTDITERKLAEEKLMTTEIRLRSLIEQTTDAVFCYEFNQPISIDLPIEKQVELMYDCILVDCNLVCAQSYGYDRVEDVIGRKLTDLFGTTPSSLDKLFRDMIDGDYRIVDGVGVEKLPNGEERFFLNNGHGVIENGKLLRIWGTFRDITDRIKTEQALKESEEKFRNISEQSLIGIGIVQDSIVKYANKKFADIFGYTVDEMSNWSPEEFMKTVHPDDMKFVFDQVKKKLSGSEDYLENYQFRGIKKSGEIIWIENYTKTIMYEGRFADFVAFIDISERKYAQQELIKLTQLKSELLRRTSHELKTPLVSIKGFTELLLEVHRDKLDALIISTLNEIKQGCLRLETLIGDILKTAELESGTTQLHKLKEDLSFLVRLCVNEIKGFSKLRNHTITVELQDNLITQFEKEQIHQVISNLLNNAVKYTPPNGLIEIKSDIRDDFIILSIKDNGIGFTEEEKSRIFKQFGKIERYGKGLDIIAEGSGFGLFISKKIIKLHGGEIWVESDGRNKGSTFHISLPLI